jgi:NAD(P)-dependent dehydrogenase (short-subunit alcohol dehydrogenase family)
MHDRSDVSSREHYGEFRGAPVIVLGGGRGIGAAIVDAFHGLGANVAIVDRNEAEATMLAKKMEMRASVSEALCVPKVFCADLTIESERERTLDAVVAAIGPPRVVISTMGSDTRFDLNTVTQADLERQVITNGIAPVLAARQLLAPMRKGGGGAVCLFTSRHGSELFELDALGYAGGKAFLEAGIQTLAIEAGTSNTPDNIIRIFGFRPGWVQTESQRSRYPRQVFENSIHSQLIPLATYAEDLTSSVVHLCSNHARRFSGRIYQEDGGEGRLKR